MRTPKKSKKCIFVLGMHRSGTSAFAGSLRATGLDLGDNLMPANSFNEKGYFEDLDIQRLNDQILSSYGRTWDSLYPFGVVEDDFLKKEIQAIYLEKFENSAVAVIKDPRISFLFPAWRAALKELNIHCYAVIMLRNPIEVAGSLKHRDRFSLAKSLLLWANYSIYAERNTRNVDRLFVRHENFLKNPGHYIRSLITLISSNVKVTRHALKEIQNFIDPSLQHHQSAKMEMPEPFHWVSDLWNGLLGENVDLSASDEALTKFKRTVDLYYPEDISRTLSADLEFPKSALHIDTGSGFEGQQKVHVPFDCRNNSFSVNFRALGKFKGMRAVRWDPTEREFIKLRIDSIVAVDSEGNQVEINKGELKSNGNTKLDKPVEFHTTDPWIEITLNLPITEITIRGRIWLLDTRNLFRNLNNQLSQAKKEIQAADNAKAQITHEKDEWFRETRAQVTEIRKLLEEKGDLLKELGDTNIRLATVSVDAERHSAELKQMKLETESIGARLKQKDNLIAQTKSDYEKITTEFNRLKSEFSVEKQTLLKQVEALTNESTGLKSEKNALLTKVETLTNESNQLKSEFSVEKQTLLKQVEALTNESNRLKSEKDALLTQIETLTRELVRLNSEFSKEKTTIVNQVEELTAALGHLKSEFSDEKTALLIRVEALTSELNRLNSEFTDEKTTLLNQVEELMADLDRLKSEFSDEKTILLNQVEETGLEVADLIKEKSELISRVYGQKAQIRQIHQDKDRFAIQLDTEQSRVKQLEKELHTSNTIVKNLEDRIQSETKKLIEKAKSLEADIAGKSKDLTFYKGLTEGLPESAHSKWAKVILYRFDRIFNYQTPVPESYLLNNLVFDPAYYQKVHVHLKDIIKNDPKLAAKHWLAEGVFEGLAASPAFHVAFYLQKNEDLKKHFKKNYHGAIKHWIDHGIKEMRACSPEFNLQTYLSKNPKIATTFANDFTGAITYWLRHNNKQDNTTSVKGQATSTENPKKDGGKENENPENRTNNDDPKNGKDNGHLRNGENQNYLANGKSNNAANGVNKQVAPVKAPPELVVDNNIWPTKRKKMDGKRLLSQARNREHFWYHNEAIDDILVNGHQPAALPKSIQRLLVIAHDFKLTTGVSRSISHYLNAMIALGGREFTSIEIAPHAIASVARNHVDTHDFVIINSMAPFFYHDGMIDLIRSHPRHKSAVYLHETQWVFDKLRREQPERFEQFVKALPEFNVLCVSRAQQVWLQEQYGVQTSFLIHEGTVLSKLPAHDTFRDEIDTGGQIHIAMAGTIQPRKGPTLFSKVADMAHSSGLPWVFSWAGLQVTKDDSVYKSPNVNWLNNLDYSSMSDFLFNADVFFLSSEDDPFPLCVLEALQAKKRVVVYKNTGASELFFGEQNSPGIIFHNYTPEAAFEALRKAVTVRCTLDYFEQINKTFSLSSFISRLNGAISEIYRS